MEHEMAYPLLRIHTILGRFLSLNAGLCSLLLSGCGWMFHAGCYLETECGFNSINPVIKATITRGSIPGRLGKESKTAVVLIHGIFGDTETFGNLSQKLSKDFPNVDVYSMYYWSDTVAPNFQRLTDLGTTLQKRWFTEFSDGVPELVDI